MFHALFARLTHLSQIHRSRRQLSRLTDDHLRDIGICRHAAELEADRSPWEGSGFGKSRNADPGASNVPAFRR